MDLLAGLALAVQADGLDLDDVVRLLLQVPEDAGAAGGVDFTDEALRVSFLSLGGPQEDTGSVNWSLLLIITASQLVFNGGSHADSHCGMLFGFSSKKSRNQFAAKAGICVHSLFNWKL